MSEELVWYAAYGSNLLRERFMCYIQGGSPEGARKAVRGCSDRTPPHGDRTITIPHELYFARDSPVWGGGVAFIDPRKTFDAGTLGRMYLITREQFVQVVRQENTLDPDDDGLVIDLDEVVILGEAVVAGGWYGRILHLGFEMPYPMFTFTTPESGDVPPTPPGESYISTIIRGLREAYRLDDREIVIYLKESKGIRGTLSETALENMVRTSRQV